MTLSGGFSLAYLIVLLMAAVIAVPLMKRLGLSAILGYMLAGLAIGPWGLGWIKDYDGALHLAEYGVVMMMFVIGLELEPKRLWDLRRAILTAGGSQVLLCGIGLTAACMAMGLDWRTSIVGGLAFTLSSTAMSVQTLTDRSLIRGPMGVTAFMILLFQDVAAIPIMTLIPALGEGGSTAPTASGWFEALRAIAILLTVFTLGKLVVRRLLRVVAETASREVFTACALLIVVGIAGLMQALGLSMALGAFIAGVLLADSEYRHALEADLEPFKGLLLGLFFMAVGMSMNLGVAYAAPLTVLGLAALLILVKAVLLILVARITGTASAQRPLFALILAQGGEFGFVIFSIAAANRVITQDHASLLTIVIALSMIANPLLLLAYDRLSGVMAKHRPVLADDIGLEDRSHIIIAGFGRVGQIVGRLLFANGQSATVLDIDPELIDTARRFGFKIFYGDATRLELLEQAGARTAKTLVIALDDMDGALKLAGLAKQHFPHLTVIARARSMGHLHKLMDQGVHVIERETFDSSLRMGRSVLESTGVSPHEARYAAEAFRRRNLKDIVLAHPHQGDMDTLVSLSRQTAAELEKMYQADIKGRSRTDWTAPKPDDQQG